MKNEKNASIVGNRKNKALVEKAAQIIFTICASLAILAVISITLYMIISGTPAIFKVGLGEILFNTVWKPTADPASCGNHTGHPFRRAGGNSKRSVYR